MESPIDAAKVSMENARAAMEKIDHYIEGLVDMQQREPERGTHKIRVILNARVLYA
jgi:hypothetical protein